MKIALKELRETHIWLQLIDYKTLIKPADKHKSILSKCNELIAIFVASVATARTNMERKKRRSGEEQENAEQSNSGARNNVLPFDVPIVQCSNG